MKKVAIFVDVSNLYYCIGKRYEARKLDYRKYLDLCQTDFGEVYQAYAYGSYSGDKANSFISFLKKINFTCKFKERGEDKYRANWNAAIAVDVVNIVDRVDTVILGSADPNLLPVIEWAKAKGVSVIIIASNINHILKQACNQFIEIPEELLEDEKEVVQEPGE